MFQQENPTKKWQHGTDKRRLKMCGPSVVSLWSQEGDLKWSKSRPAFGRPAFSSFLVSFRDHNATTKQPHFYSRFFPCHYVTFLSSCPAGNRFFVGRFLTCAKNRNLRDGNTRKNPPAGRTWNCTGQQLIFALSATQKIRPIDSCKSPDQKRRFWRKVS